MLDCENVIDEEMVVVLHPGIISVFIFFSLPSVFLSLLLYLPQKLMWVTERVGKVRLLYKCTDLRTNLFIVFTNCAQQCACWQSINHLFSHCSQKMFDAALISEIVFFFPPEYNPQMVCLINSRRTVETEHPFKEKVLNRHDWSSVEATEKYKKKTKYLAFIFFWRIIRNRCRNIPLFSTKHP